MRKIIAGIFGTKASDLLSAKKLSELPAYVLVAIPIPELMKKERIERAVRDDINSRHAKISFRPRFARVVRVTAAINKNSLERKALPIKVIWLRRRQKRNADPFDDALLVFPGHNPEIGGEQRCYRFRFHVTERPRQRTECN